MPPTTRSQTKRIKSKSPLRSPLKGPTFKVPTGKVPTGKQVAFKKSPSAQSKVINALKSLSKVSLGDKTLKKKPTSKAKSAKLKTHFRWKALVSNLREHTLKILCSDAGVCLAFGKLTDRIKKNFEGFTNFRYAVAPVVRIGKPSANGFINQIEYVRNEYNSYAVLKSSATANADNLMYEYVVGQFINKLNKIFPCFLETYGMYRYKDDSVWQQLKNNKSNDIAVLTNGLDLIETVDYGVGCESSKYIAILIQHLKGIEPLEDCLNNDVFLANELLITLFQVYVPLGKIKDYFSHYDLHRGNIQLYKPVEDKYIEYHYHITSHKTISFKSSYMTKIIDYGRSYFYNNSDFFTHENADNLNSKHIYDTQICRTPKCNSIVDVEETVIKKKKDVTVLNKKQNFCGFYSGFGWMNDDSPDPASSFYISTQHKNISHDLRALYEVLEHISKYRPALLNKPEYKWLKKLVYIHEYGTPQQLNSGLPQQILNVEDAAMVLIELLDTASFRQKNNAAYAGKTKLGDLHVYMNMFPMDYDSALKGEAFLKNKIIV